MATQKEEKRLFQMQTFAKLEEAGNREWRERAKECDRFATGFSQWDNDDLEILKDEGRPELTINKILPILNVLSGTERETRQDFKVSPRRGGIGRIASMHTELMKYVMDSSEGDQIMSTVFDDGDRCGKGWVGLEKDFLDDPINGDLKIARYSPYDMGEDPDAEEYDLNVSAKYIFRRWMWDKQELILNFPQKKNELEGDIGSTIAAGDIGLEMETLAAETSTPLDFGTLENFDNKNPLTDAHKRLRFAVREVWWKTHEEVGYLMEIQRSQIQRFTTKKIMVDAKKMAKSQPKRFRYIRRVEPLLHRTTYVGNVILNDEEDPLRGIQDFPFYRFAPYWVDGYMFGVVDNLIDPQKEHNKRRSQVLHHLNQSANSGWIVDENGLATTQQHSIEEMGSKPGIIIKARTNARVERISPAPLSSGHMTLSEAAANDMKDISGINPDLQGQKVSANDSGVAIARRQQQGLVISRVIFDNFQYTYRLLGNGMLTVIRKQPVFSPEEVAMIVAEENLEVDPKEFEQFKNKGHYGVKVTLRPTSPTVRLSYFAELMDAMIGGAIPPMPELLIEASDWPFKEKLMKNLKQIQQSQAEAVEKQQSFDLAMEVQKQQSAENREHIKAGAKRTQERAAG